MKNLSVIGIFCFFLISCTQNRESEFSTQDFFNSGTITISGHITNLSPNNSRNIFLFRYDILSGDDEGTTIKIDSSGKFEKILPVFSPQEISLDYQNRLISLLVKQSDSLFLIIDAQNQDKDITISGKGGERNTCFHQYNQLSSILIRDYFRSVSGKDLIFILKEYRKTKERLDSITNRIFANNQPDALLTNWINADKESIGNYNFIRFASMNETLPATFLSNQKLITEKVLNNDAFYCNSSYTMDIFNNYIGGCVMKENREQLGDIFNKLKSDNYEDAITLCADSIYKDFKHIGKDIVMYQLFQQMIHPNFGEMVGKELNIDLLKKYYLLNLKNEYIRTLVLNTTDQYQDTVHDRLSTDNSEDILGSLFQKFKDKVLYVDISATWCSPCVRELPYSNALHESLSDKGVVFVYLFANSTLTDWKELSKKYDIQGENVLLSDEQYNFLLSKYDINTGVPQYLLIDKTGQITHNAKRPSEVGIKEDILKLLE